MTPHSGSDGHAPFFADFVDGRRGQILDAALTVFSAKGYDCGTMREIAGVLGVSEPALYRHYAGKEALYADLIAMAGARVVDAARQRMAEVRPENLRDSLAMLIASGPARRPGPGAILRMLLIGTPHQPTLLAAFREHLALPMFEAICEFVPGIDAFYGIERSTAETESHARAVMSLFIGYSMTSMMLGAADQDDAVIDAVIATMGWCETGAV